MGKTKNFQFVWPKDGYKGRDKRGFWGRLNNILTDRGPDVFLQRKGSSTPIKPDWWGNWDSYHDPYYHTREITNSFPCASRGTRRYDPQSRTYEHWSIPSDWYGNRVGPWPDYQPHYPRFTREEWAKINRRLRRGRLVDPLTMGKDWHQDGPKRFDYEHDWFWQNAHRAGENLRQGFAPTSNINPFLRMHQSDPYDLSEWIRDEY